MMIWNRELQPWDDGFSQEDEYLSSTGGDELWLDSTEIWGAKWVDHVSSFNYHLVNKHRYWKFPMYKKMMNFAIEDWLNMVMFQFTMFTR